MWKCEKKEKTLNTKLFVRILPSTDFHYESIKTETNKKVLYVRCLQDFSKGINLKNPNYWYFCTDGVFWNACQSEVYEAVTSGLYEDLFDGVRAVILSYGQTGTGKTFTTSGFRLPFQNRGLILRVLSQLFEEQEIRRDVSRIGIGMSYLEFIGQNIKDLISGKQLKNARDVAEYPVQNETRAWKQLFDAESKKSFAESAPYGGSNRGHSVLTYYVHAESLIDTDPVIKHSKIHIVDMGGIDYLGSTSTAWRGKTDVGSSNLSKSLMEQLILCLSGRHCENENCFCPYKSDRFLLYLHDTLRNSCLLRFVAHINGSFENLALTISTLRFGERIRALRPTKLERIYQSNQDLQIINLEKEYFRMKYEAELMGMLKDSPDYSNVSQEKLQEIRRAAEAFLFNKLEDLTLFSLGQASLTLDVFRDLYRKLSAEKEQIVRNSIAAATEIIQSQTGIERPPTLNANISASAQKVSRRRSRQLSESQTSFGVPYRSTDSVHTVGRVLSAVHQAGMTDRKGIGVGPGKTSSAFEGNVTKAFKKLKSKKSESVIAKGTKSAPTKEVGVLSSKNQLSDENSELSFGQDIPSRESAWCNFFNEKTDFASELSERVENAEENAKEAKRKYTRALGELARVREEIEEKKLELESCQHIRQIYGKGDVDEEGNLLPDESQRKLLGILQQKEDLANKAVEACHVALIDYRNASEELTEAKSVLEEVFQDFCREHYKTVFAPGNLALSEIKAEESDKKVQLEPDIKNQSKIELYTRLQEKFFRWVERPKNTKREWVKLF